MSGEDTAIWKTLAQAAPDYLCILGSNLRYVWVNRVHGALTLDDIIGHSLDEFVTPQTFELARTCVERVLATKEPGSYTAESFVDDRRQFLLCRVSPLDGRDDQVLIATTDVTEQRQAEEDLRNTAASLRRVIQMYPHIILVLEPDGTVVDTNDLTAGALRSNRDELIGTCAWDRMDPAVADQRRAWAKEVTATRKPLHKVDEHRGRVFDTLAYPMPDADGAIRHIAIVSRDITEQRRAQEILREHEARRFRAERMEALGTLAAGIAHDFNNLLTPIAHNAALAARESVTSEARERMLAEIARSADRAAKLVRQILTYGRDDADNIGPLDIGAATSEVASMIRASLAADVNIDVKLPDHAVWIEAHGAAVEQAVTNLCINAGQAMPDGGTVSVTVSETSADLPHELEPGTYVCIRVRDTGAGIDAESLPRIFDPFYSTKSPDQGSGLGLFVVHRVAQLHRGAVTVTSEPERGTELCLWLPSRSSRAQSPEPPRGKLDKAPESRHVLFLDDERTILTAASATLDIVGHSTAAFERASAALAAFRAAPETFDVAVLDQRLVDGHGFDVAVALRAVRDDLPVLICSGHVTTDLTAACEREGFAVLHKPYDVDDLLDAIAQLSR